MHVKRPGKHFPQWRLPDGKIMKSLIFGDVVSAPDIPEKRPIPPASAFGHAQTRIPRNAVFLEATLEILRFSGMSFASPTSPEHAQWRQPREEARALGFLVQLHPQSQLQK